MLIVFCSRSILFDGVVLMLQGCCDLLSNVLCFFGHVNLLLFGRIVLLSWGRLRGRFAGLTLYMDIIMGGFINNNSILDNAHPNIIYIINVIIITRSLVVHPPILPRHLQQHSLPHPHKIHPILPLAHKLPTNPHRSTQHRKPPLPNAIIIEQIIIKYRYTKTNIIVWVY